MRELFPRQAGRGIAVCSFFIRHVFSISGAEYPLRRKHNYGDPWYEDKKYTNNSLVQRELYIIFIFGVIKTRIRSSYRCWAIVADIYS